MKLFGKIIAASAAIFLLMSTTAQAQSGSSLLDKTFASVGAGLNACILHPTQPKTWGNVGFATDINVGIRWNPYISNRLGFHGGWNNCAQDLDLLDVEAGTSFGFKYLHADILCNLTNTSLGEENTGIWDASVYAHTGAVKLSGSRTLFSKGTTTWGGGLGLLNEIKVCKEVYVTIDLQAIVANPSSFDSNGGRMVVFPTGTVGVCFNLGEIF